MWRRMASAADELDHLALAWLCVLVSLLAFGRQHGETNRLWAFMSPLGCMLVARYMHDLVPSRWWWVPLALLVLSLGLARQQLTYF